MEDRNITPTDVVSGTQPTSGGESPAQPLQPVASSRPARHLGAPRGFVRLAIAVAIVLLVIAGGLYIFLTRNQHQANNAGSVQPASNYDVQDIALEDLTSAGALGLNTSQALSINGQLRTNGSLILTPSARPQNAVKGQMYYDTATNTPYVYDGSNFVSLSVSQAVKSIGGQMGDIALGPGLLLQSGQLALDSNLLNTITRVNTIPTTNQVTSVQGQTGAVAFSSGAGITINGTTIANSGVLAITAASPQLAVTQGANGTYSIGTVGNLATASGTAGQVAVFDSANNLVSSLLSQVGSVMTVSGDLRVANQIQTNTITSLTPGQNLAISAGNDQLVFTSGGITFQLPSSGGATQTICTVGMNCTTGGGATYIQLQPGTAQNDTGGGPSIYINNTGAGDLLRLQGNATDSFVVANNGDTSIAGNLAVTGTINGAVVSGGALTATSVNGLNVSSTAVSSGGALALSAAANQNISLNTSGTGVVTLGTTQLQGSGALTISAGGTDQNLTLTGTGLGNVVVQNPVFHNANGATYRFDSADLAAVNAVVCTSVGNCSSGLGGSGTAGVIAVWNGSGFTLGDSLLSQDTTSGLVTVAGDLAADNLQGNGAGLTNVNAALLNGQAGAYYLNASNLNTGTLDDQRLSANIARLNTNANFTGTLQQGGNDVCTTAGNCVGTGGAVGGSGTPGTIAVWNGSGFTLGDSLLSQSGTAISANGNLTVSGDVTAANLQGNGSAITNVNAAQLNGQSASYYLNATNIASGTLADARLSSNVTLQGNIFNGAGQLVQLNASSQLPAVSGALVTGLNAGNIASGTLSDARLSGNVALLNTAANFTGSSLQFNGNNVCTTAGNCAGVGGGVTTAGGTPGTIAVFDGAGFSIADSLLSQSGGVVTISGNLVATSLSGDGAAVTNVNAAQLNGQGAAYYLDASNINAGTLNDARLSSNVTLQGNTFNGANQLVRLDATGALPALDGSNLTNVNAALLGGQNGAYYLNLTNATGTLSDARLSSNVALFDAATANFTGTLQQGGNDVCTTAGNCVGSGTSVGGSGTAGTIAVWNGSGFTLTDSLLSQSGTLVTVSGDLAADNLQGNGAGVTNVNAVQLNGQTAAYYLNASNVSAGTLADARLSANVTLQGNVFNGAGQLVQLNASSQLPAVSGALLTDLDADQISAGTLSDARLSGNVALLNAAANFTGSALQFNGNNVCTTAGNCAGTGGGVTTTGGTAGQLAVFSGAQSLVDSIISDNGSTVTIGGTLAVNTITPTAAMTVGSTSQTLTLQGNGSTQLRATAGGFTNSLSFATPSGSNKSIVIPNASGTVAVSASGPISIDANGNISCVTCTTSGGGSGGAVDSLNGLNGALTIANASGSGATITIDDATTTTKGIASFNSANLTVTAGAVNTIQNISVTSTPSFAGLTLTGNLALAANSIVTSGATISSTELDVLDGGIDESEVTGAITDVTAGNGLIGGASAGNATLNIASANAGIAVNADNIALMLQPSGDGLSATTSSGSGLEILNGGLTLLQGCGDGQTLKWNETSDVWTCASDVDTDTGDEVSVNGASTTGANFINTIVSGTTAGVTWNLNTTPSPDDISITISNASATDAGVVTTGAQSFAGVKTFGSQIVANGGVNLGAQTLQGTTAVIDFTNFDVAANGDTTIGGALTVAGTTALNGDVTVAAGKSLTLVGGATGTRPSSPTEGMVYFDTTTKQLLTYANGKWQADRSTSTKIVASGGFSGCSGSVPVASANPDSADYVTNSCTSAQTAINTAISALPAGGGMIYLMEGTYIVDGSINFVSNLKIVGAGNSTIIKLKNGINANIDLLANPVGTKSNISVSNLKLDGNKANNTSGTQVGIQGSSIGTTTAPGLTVRDVYIENFRTYGIYVVGGAKDIITNNFVTLNGSDGIYLNGNVSATVSDNEVRSNTGMGIVTTAAGVTVSHNRVISNTSDGINANGDRSTIIGNILDSNSGSGITMGGSNGSVAGNTVYASGNNGIYLPTATSSTVVSGNAVTNSGWHGIRIYNSSLNNIISDNTITNSGMTTASNSGIVIDANSDNNRVTNNRITDTAGTGYAIQITGPTNDSVNVYLAGNTYSGTGASSIDDQGTGTIYGGQVNASGNYLVQPAGTIELMKTTNVTGDLNVSANGDFNGSLTVGNANQFVISSTGVVTSGTWQGTAVADAYVADNLTINSAGTVDWQALSNYPAACAAGSAITQLGDTVTCQAFATASGSGSYIQNQFATDQTADFRISGVARANTAVVTPAIRPVSDSTTALSIQNAAGSTNILTVDSTNARIGIGTTPSYKLHVADTTTANSGTNNIGAFFNYTVNPSSAPAAITTYYGQQTFNTSSSANLNANVTMYGDVSTVQNAGAATLGAAVGSGAIAQNSGTGVITNAIAGRFKASNIGSGSITNGIALQASMPEVTAGSIGTAYGLFIDTQKVAGVGTGYGIWQGGASDLNVFAGKVGIGTIPSTYALEVNGTGLFGTSVLTPTVDAAGATALNIGTTNATQINLNKNVVVAANQSLTITGGATGTRPSSPTEGMIYYDTTTKQLLTYANGKWQADRESNTKIVAASNSTQAAKDAADYVANGDTAAAGDGDQVEINAAITAAGTGKVYLMEGTYTIDATINLGGNRTIAGAGKGSIVQLADLDADIDMLTVNGGRSVIRDLYLDGRSDLNTAGIQRGINSTASAGDLLVESNYLTRFRTQGFYSNSFSSQNNIKSNTFASNVTAIQANGSSDVIDGNIFASNTVEAVQLFGSGSVLSGNTFTGNAVGINVSGANVVTGNTVKSSTSYAISAQNSGSTVTNNIVTGNTGGGILVQGTNALISGNRIIDNGGATFNNGIDMTSTAADNNTVTNNVITDSSATTTNYAIAMVSGATGNYLSNNTLGTGTINSPDASTIYGGQVNSSGNYVVQPAGTIELMKTTDITGDLNVSANGDFNGTLTVGNANQFVISSTGVVTSGTWQGAAIVDTYVADNLTINSSGSVDWQALTNYPAACAAGSAITQLGDSITCSTFAATSGSGSYIQNQNASAQTTADFWISGVGRADTRFITPAITSTGDLSINPAPGAILNLATTNGSAVNISQAGSATTVNGSLTVGQAATFNSSVTIAAGKSLTLTGSGTRPASPTAGMLYYDTNVNQLLYYDGGKWTTARASTSIVIAASNSSAGDKDSADIVANGTNDQTTINTAISWLGSGGGVVYLMAGTYNLTGSINVPNNTTLSGAGAATVLTYPNNMANATYKAITNSDVTTGTRVNIRDLTIDGNKANQTTGNFYGIYLDHMGSGSGSSAVDGAKVTNVIVKNMYGWGIYLTASNNNTITGVTSNSANVYGISLNASSNNNTITSNTLQDNGSAGINLNSSNNNTVSGNTTQGNNYGIFLQTSSTNTITGNTTQGNTNYGMRLDTSSNNTITGNTIRDNGTRGLTLISSSNSNNITGNSFYDNGGSTANNAIYLDASDSNTVSSNTINDSSATTTNYAINVFNSTADTNYLSGNTLGTGSVNDAGTGTVYGGQVNASGNYQIQPAGTIELMKNTNVTGALAVTQTTTLSSTLSVGGLSTLAGFTSTADSTVRATSATAFQIQNGASATLLTADTSSMQIVVGSGGNTITLSPTNGFRLAGTARNSKTIRLLAEYPSVVLAADLTNNLGTMTSGYDSTARMNYYNWTTTQGTNQDYDIVVQVPLPTDFDSWDGSNPLSISTYTTNTANGTITLEARDSSGAVICNYVNVTPGSTTTWAANNSACTLSTGTYTPGDYITLRIKLQAPNGGNTRVGNIVLNYKSKF